MFICVHLAVLLPSLMRMALGLVLFILEFDFISRGVIMKRYLKVSCWSYYYVLIDNYYNRGMEAGELGMKLKD